MAERPSDDALADRLATFADSLFASPGHRVENLVRLSGGASRETFALDLFGPDPNGHPRRLILQRVRTGAMATTLSMRSEATLLTAAAESGVPVPAVVAASDDADVAGAPFTLVERLEGETVARRLLRDAEFASAREVVVEQCAVALAAVHRIPLSAASGLSDADPLALMRSLLDNMGQPHPAFEIGMRWLDDHRPASVPSRVVHGDFRLGNLLVGSDGLRAVLDWELAHLGDPAEDLGWLCVRAWRFGNRSPVCGLGSYAELLDAYERAGGEPVELARLRWWEAMGTLRWGVICILQAATHLSGASRSVELAAIGRRVCENEFDLLRLVDPTLVATPSVADEGEHVSLHGAPDAATLVDAVREFLERDVLGATEGRVRFHSRVASNVLGMVERELRAGDAPVQRHSERLAALGAADDRELAAALRAGDVDASPGDVRASVFASVVDKLRVANPAYLDDTVES